MTLYTITPCPAPRMTQRDRWKKRDCVVRYFKFRDMVRLMDIKIPECGANVVFYMPMPAGWSKAKRDKHLGKPHKQKPDIDNLLKGLLDAVFEEDCVVWQITVKKMWAEQGAISVNVDRVNTKLLGG